MEEMRLAVFYFLLVISQGLLSALFAPLPAPDLFLLAVLTLLWRLPPWLLVLVGYGVGLLQDVMGQGVFGFHALALAGSAFTASLVRIQLTQSGFFEQLLVVLSAVAGKWLLIALLLLWLSGSLQSLEAIPAVAPIEVAFTMLASLLVLPWGQALLERTAMLRKELL